jgi:hypothetical protein
VFVFCKSYLTNHGAKDGIISALRLVSRFKGRHCPSIFSIYAYVQASIQTLSTYVGGANATNSGS